MEVCKHVSRAACTEIAQHYQVPLEQVMTIGDGFNDLPMLQQLDSGVAMGNAPEAVKTKGKNRHQKQQ